MKGRMPMFWFAVGGTAIIAEIVFNVAADRLPFQSLKTLNAYATRQNG